MNFVRIDGFPNYVIHPAGTILRIWKNKTKEMKTYNEPNGYMRIELSNNGKPKKFFVHRLLALHFIPNPENKPCIDHINGIRNDNRLENLRWVTYQENMAGFRSNPPAEITKGGMRKTISGWEWRYYMSAIKKSKYMNCKESLEKFCDETLKKYLI